MHEFSLATEIIDIAKKAAINAKKDKITQIKLQIGNLAGVEIRALLTALESLMQEQIVKDAEIITSIVRAKAKCTDCESEFEPSDLLEPCPECSSFSKSVLAGKEFNVLSIDAE